MNDVIIIKDLEVFAHHGVFDEETRLGQKFLICAELYTDFSNAVADDSLEMSVDYGAVCKKITEFLQSYTYKLIETVADKTAQMLLDEYPLLNGVKLEIKKPWAPIGLPLSYVSVVTEKRWHTAFVALGSNLGNKKGYLDFGVKALRETDGCRVEKVSDYIETEPYGYVEQDSFANAVACIKTTLSPKNLLELLNKIEQEAGRTREIHWGPRTLDLDIIFYDNQVICTEKLQIPHPDMHNRSFVLTPLCQIAPYVRHSVLNKTVAQLSDELSARQGKE